MADDKMLKKVLTQIQKLVIEINHTFQWGDNEKELHKEFETRQRAVDERLCDNIDTAGACNELRQIVSATNKYLAKAAVPDARLLTLVVL